MRRVFAILGLGLLAGFALGQNQGNWKLAEKFSPTALRPYIYSSRVTPTFLKESDKFWYMWREATGKRFMFVDPDKRKKEQLFDHVTFAAQLSELHKKPYEAAGLPFDTVTMTDANTVWVTLDNKWYSYDREKETLKREEKAPPSQTPATPPGGGPGQGGGGGGGAAQAANYRNRSGDKKAYVYAQNFQLWVTESEKDDDTLAKQISFDGEKDYSFGGGFFATEFLSENALPDANRKVRANVTWSEDSKRFYVTRFDSRKVRELFLVNSLTEPRPSLMRYRYAMPGEENVPQQEVWVYTRANRQFKKHNLSKFKDQLLMGIHFTPDGNSLRFVRRDRLQRNLEFCELNLDTSETKILLTEAVDNAFLEIQPVRYIKPGGDFLWFSERTGWGHYYRYSFDGKLLNAVTKGPWRANSIETVDEKTGKIWVNGVGYDPKENPYYSHAFSVNADGTDFRSITPGMADHSVTMSFTKKFAVDSYSRVDLPSSNSVFDEKGNRILELETQDLSRLEAIGWKMPETFTVKSDDGVVDIYGNMWKPFDFDPKKKYPIILNIYPGPQTESVTAAFSATATTQTLAQLGFIVIQIGNRGGNPMRSNAYHSYGYYNLRDYGLADKKAGVEQLAAKYPWIDIDKVGIFGHSGGGFMTAAALLLPPYNEFFKVGVSSAGNHDNNIYNSNWSEQHHGLRQTTSLFDSGSSSSTKTTPDDWANEVTSDPLDAILFEQQTQDQKKTEEQKKVDDTKKTEEQKKTEETKKTENIKFEIKVPTTHELAPNLVGKLLVVHGDMDNNVHPGNSTRLVNALIKANKRFDFMIMPGQAHGFGPMQPYFTQMLQEYFCEHLLGDGYRKSADMKVKGGK